MERNQLVVILRQAGRHLGPALLAVGLSTGPVFRVGEGGESGESTGSRPEWTVPRMFGSGTGEVAGNHLGKGERARGVQF
jgi:hypothetical protein